MRVALLLPLLLALPAYAQDLDGAIRTAIEGKRYALRRAAATKVAQAGDEAVPPLKAFVAEHDRNSLPLELVDAIARADSIGPAMRGLLREWSGDREFYWRAQALGGLARAADHSDTGRFRAALHDASHLFRIEGARGLLAVSGEKRDVEALHALAGDDPDPRTRLRIALALVAHDDRSAVSQIVDALRGADRKFLDDPWGSRELQEVLRTLRDLGHDFGAAAGPAGPERDAAAKALVTWLGIPDADLSPLADPPEATACDSGIEVRSCRNGDLFLRFSADGTLCVGLSPVKVMRVDQKALTDLRAALVPEVGTAVHGAVICDYLRLRIVVKDDALAHHKCAPGAVPESLAAWLKRLAAVIEKTDAEAASCPLTDRLAQFLPRANK
ncbi:MAG: hypothetical protein U1F36_16150 [Planctomycetota bacterium]